MNPIRPIFSAAAATNPAPTRSCLDSIKDLIARVIEGVKKIFCYCYSKSSTPPAIVLSPTPPALQPQINRQVPLANAPLPVPIGREPHLQPQPAIPLQPVINRQVPLANAPLPDPIGREPHFQPQPIGPGHSENYRKIMEFYQNCQPNDDGRTIVDCWRLGFDELENAHNYIQWLFPTVRPSNFNPAPTLDPEVIQAFRQNPGLRDKLEYSFLTMLQFYGLYYGPNDDIVRMNFQERSRNWLTPGNHNFLRISRILSSLDTLGLGRLSQRFIVILRDIAANEGRGIVGNSLRHWEGAAVGRG